jgi:hypothetical protein
MGSQLNRRKNSKLMPILMIHKFNKLGVNLKIQDRVQLRLLIHHSKMHLSHRIIVL